MLSASAGSTPVTIGMFWRPGCIIGSITLVTYLLADVDSNVLVSDGVTVLARQVIVDLLVHNILYSIICVIVSLQDSQSFR